MAISLLSLGDAATAEQEIAHAGELAPPSARGLVDLLGALVLQRTGQLDASLAAYDRALPRLRRSRDEPNLARLLLNRGTLRAYQGDFQGALDDLQESERLAAAHELWALAAMAAHNLGFTFGRKGDVPAALAAFDRAEAAYASQGNPPRSVAVLAADRCEVFLSVGLARDAVQAAQRALTVHDTSSDATHHAEARLLLAGPASPRGRRGGAGRGGGGGGRVRAARRAPWAAVADYVAMQAEILATEDGEPRRRPGCSPAHGGSRACWRCRGGRSRPCTCARSWRGWPWPCTAPRWPAASWPMWRTPGGEARLGYVEAWHATALLRLAEDDRAGAKRALRRGLDVVDDHRAALGATELRSGATAHGADLARLGLRLAVADGRPTEVLRWAEHGRAGALRLPASRPPRTPPSPATCRTP